MASSYLFARSFFLLLLDMCSYCFFFLLLAVFPEGSPVMSVEAAGIQGWQRWAHAPFGMARFGASAPFKAIYDKFGFTVENLTKQASFFFQQHMYVLLSCGCCCGC